jgi:hypothetical protein
MTTFTYSCFAVIAAEKRDLSVEELEPRIDRSKVEAARAAAFGRPGEIVLYPEPVGQAGVLCAELIRLRPLDEDNKKVAFDCMLELLSRYEWKWFAATRGEIAKKLDGLGAGTIGVPEFVLWVRAKVGRGESAWYERRATA